MAKTKQHPDDLIYELRGGNLVKCKVSNDAGIYTIIMIDIWNHKVMLSGARQGEWHHISKIKPIKLTKEWFEYQIKNRRDEKSYFYNMDGKDYAICMSSGLFMVIDEDDFALTVGQGNVFSHDLIKLKYIHELQNIYIDLSKEALPINN